MLAVFHGVKAVGKLVLAFVKLVLAVRAGGAHTKLFIFPFYKISHELDQAHLDADDRDAVFPEQEKGCAGTLEEVSIFIC